MESSVKMQSLFNDSLFYCPLCERYFSGSSYLKANINNIKTLWLANMVTHYRHEHITSWNKCWGKAGRYYRAGWFGDYEEEKKKVNERAKRQIMRKAKDYLLYHNFQVSDIAELQNNDPKTIELAKKLFWRLEVDKYELLEGLIVTEK